MTTLQTTATAPDDAVVANGQRMLRHVEAEKTNDIDQVMATVTASAELTWSGTHCWTTPQRRPDGTLGLTLITDYDEIRAFYERQREGFHTLSFSRPFVDLRSDWWTFMEAHAQFQDQKSNEIYEQTWVLFALMDGSDGISGEITYGRFPELEPADSVTEIDRATGYPATSTRSAPMMLVQQ